MNVAYLDVYICSSKLNDSLHLIVTLIDNFEQRSILHTRFNEWYEESEPSSLWIWLSRCKDCLQAILINRKYR